MYSTVNRRCRLFACFFVSDLLLFTACKPALWDTRMTSSNIGCVAKKKSFGILWSVMILFIAYLALRAHGPCSTYVCYQNSNFRAFECMPWKSQNLKYASKMSHSRQKDEWRIEILHEWASLCHEWLKARILATSDIMMPTNDESILLESFCREWHYY